MMNESGRARELFVTGLRNAHALESQATQIMQRQVERYENYPELTARLQQHIAETRNQQQRLEDILGGLGESHSTLKDMALGFMGNLATMGHVFAPDEVLKNSFANLAFENFEIASYKSLITIAEAAGQAAAMGPLEATLKEEQSMARWVDDHLRDITLRFLALENQGVSAKV